MQINMLLGIIIIIFIIINYIHLIYKSKNLGRHKNSGSLYAHFSKIDHYNYLLFPKLIFAHPHYFTLKKGQSLYIPRKWWHWVKTTKKTSAVNYWFSNKIKNNKPFLMKKIFIDYDINFLNNEKIIIWKSDNDTESIRTNFKKFYNSKKDNNYIITAEDYTHGKSNNNIKNKMKPHINFPLDNRIDICDDNTKIVNENNYGYNIWISSGIHDTGLHYDDEDGVLSVIEGEKTIILFPPSDSKYLYPYNVSYEWLNSKPINFRYNSYAYHGKITGISSSQLLYETCKHDIRVLSNISKIYYNNKSDRLIWGFKKNKDIYRWEIYLFDLLNEIKVKSWDVHSRSYNIPDEEHHYYKIGNIYDVRLPFWGYGKYKKNNILYYESKIFVIDTHGSFKYNYDSYMDKLEYSAIKDKFKNIILNKYSCYELCIFNKTVDQIFVMYLGISSKNFLEFLINGNYPENIINFVENKMSSYEYYINNEITIVYDINTMEIIRSGFYGNM